ncbi:nucleic-acid-binding protein from mobile element jockey [Plakobranchus ocellatus]|uniref:Nucleic-acid-binding protein from mobile element jockey n=1 Tax=Plakobranchus ocellatus TaxID=259542 RepID=A0AAV4BYS0_9GAST|nr:nucleic-acid-binding protein from mobile element jockey [Plakobranchus ocellatus]
MVELKSNDQAKKLGAIATFLDIPVTVSPHKSLNSSKEVIRSRDLRCCSEEEMVEELSGVTHARCIKVRRDEDKIQTDTVVLIFNSPKPQSRIRAGYLTLDVRPYVPLPMRCYRCQRYGYGKDRCKKPAAVCIRCGKGGHVERDCSADSLCVNCKGDHAASSKTCTKFLEEQAILRYKAENGGSFQQARKADVVELHKTISTRTFASAVKSQLRTKPAALPKVAAEVPLLPRPRGKKPRRILRLPVPREQQNLKYQPSAGPKSKKDRRPLGKQSIVLRLWRWMLRILYPQSGAIPPPPAPQGPPPPLWSALPPPPNPNPPPNPAPRHRWRNPKVSQRVACQAINSLW